MRALTSASPARVEKYLTLSRAWRRFYDQGREGACVGFACSQMMSVLNRERYDARWLWNEAKKIDEWVDTNPGDDNGTSLRAAGDILRHLGHRRVLRGRVHPEDTTRGIHANRWAQTIDEIRQSISSGVPVVMGTNWYASFDSPERRNGEYWVGGSGDLGALRGGHAWLLEAASDRRQAFRTPNSWGDLASTRVWFPYTLVERLLGEYGEAMLVTDR